MQYVIFGIILIAFAVLVIKSYAKSSQPAAAERAAIRPKR